MQIITDIDQGTPEWLALRLGIITCSELDCLLVAGGGDRSRATCYGLRQQLLQVASALFTRVRVCSIR